MADKASRRGAANTGVLMMILAFVAMGIFLYWLNIQSQKQKAVEVREDSAAAAANAEANAAVPGAQTVAPADLQSDPGKYDNQLIQLTGLAVGSLLGQQGFWLHLPGGSAFLVSLTPALIQQKVHAATGDTAMVVGTVHMLSDSIVGSWMKAGTINRQDSVSAMAAMYFLEARQVQAAGSSSGGSSSTGS